MTTIAYNHNEKKIACDGRITSETMIVDDAFKKYVIADNFVMFFAGDTSGANRMADIIATSKNGDIIESESAIDVDFMFVRDSKVFSGGVTSENEYFYDVLTSNYAIGSGCKFALSAMDFGKSAKDAVKYAMTRDSATGGKISVCDINTGKIK